MPDWAQDLDEFVREEDWRDEDFESEPPRIEDMAGAARVARRLSGLARDRADVEATAAAEIGRIRSWAEDRTFGIDKQSAWLGRALRAYMEQTGSLTASLPSGVGRLRPPRARIEFTDEDEFVAWCEQNDRDDLLAKRPSKSAVADAEDLDFREGEGDEMTSRFVVVTTDGEVVPGVQRTIGRVHSFSFAPTKEKPADDDTL